MATETVNAPSGLSERHMLALQATWEIDALMEAALGRMPHDFDDDLAVRGMCIRTKQLASAIMDAMDENGSAIGEIHQSVHAADMPEQVADHV